MKTVHRMSFKYLEIISFQNKHVAFPDNNAETSYKCITNDLKTKMSISMLYVKLEYIRTSKTKMFLKI